MARSNRSISPASIRSTGALHRRFEIMENTGPTTDSGTETDNQPRVLHIRFRRGDEQRIEETLKAIDAGETPEPYLERVFDDVDDLHRVTRPKNLELLQAIAREEPTSIRDTARLVERDIRQVHDNLNELEALGLIEFETAGRAKRPTVWYDEIAVELPLKPESGDTTVATP